MRASRRAQPLRKVATSLGNRLGLVFLAITLLAIATLYMYVAPGLRARLINERLSELTTAAHDYQRQIAANAATFKGAQSLNEIIDQASQSTGARVTLLTFSAGSSPPLSPLTDSSNQAGAAPISYRIALQSVRTRRAAQGTDSSSGSELAEAAVPVWLDGHIVRVLVFAAPVADIVSSVATVRHQILIAGVIALLLAVIGGYLVARWLSARLKRLELAAERVSRGEFAEPLPVDSRDELGQLAAALNEMQRQLAQLERARKQFIATASHELRTPIFSLGGFVELLEDEELDAPTRRRFLGHVAEQVERLRKLSVDLLDLSRLESGSLELRPEQVDLGELTRSVSAEFEVSLGQHESLLQLRLAPRVEAQCDPVRLAQIVRILIDNAVVHTPPGTNIIVTAERVDGHVRLAVRDNGEGIDPSALPRIFEPFYTADDAQGSGLGLAIASELAERMDGRLQVETAPGATVFTLEIPAGVIVAARWPPPRASSHPLTDPVS